MFMRLGEICFADYADWCFQTFGVLDCESGRSHGLNLGSSIRIFENVCWRLHDLFVRHDI